MNITKSIPIKQYWLLLKGYLIPQRFQMTVLAVFLLLQISLNLINPQIIRTFIDGLTKGIPQDILINSGILFFAVAFISQLFSISSTYFGEQVAWTATNEMRLDLLLHCLKLDASFHKDHAPGELLERIDGDVNTLSNFFSRFAILFIGNILLILGGILLLMIEDWRMTRPRDTGRRSTPSRVSWHGNGSPRYGGLGWSGPGPVRRIRVPRPSSTCSTRCR